VIVGIRDLVGNFGDILDDFEFFFENNIIGERFHRKGCLKLRRNELLNLLG
jgi:hypothetical protein